MKLSRYLIMTVLTVAFTFGLFQLSAHAETFPFDSPRWVINPKSAGVVDHLGQKSLKMQGGIAYIKDLNFTNGIIEFDVSFTRKRGFFGGVFRMQDKGNYEEYYLRPHQSGNPDATQYTPVFNGMAGWQLYHGKGYGGAMTFQFDHWIHVKLVVSGEKGELYIGDNEQPVIVMHELKRGITTGLVGLKANRFAAGYFANFSVTPSDNPPLKATAHTPAKAKPGTIMTWDVSNTFGENTLAGKTVLSAAEKSALTWKKLQCEDWGLANLSRSAKRERTKNTVFARVTINSDSEQTKTLQLGYSDRVKVYLNDGLLYSGMNNYMSRDYRYLGTIGYFDTVCLRLKKGQNELWLAVSENFGGWGILSRFEDMKGITLGQ
ncbi:MAG: hypothetical protein GY940_45315 [bacterium]|nr:hypothetical protein [bacterium]